MDWRLGGYCPAFQGLEEKMQTIRASRMRVEMWKVWWLGGRHPHIGPCLIQASKGDLGITQTTLTGHGLHGGKKLSLGP